MPGWLESISIDIAQSMIMGGSSMPKAEYDLMAIMYSAYHHGAGLLACVEHNKCLLGISCRDGV